MIEKEAGRLAADDALLGISSSGGSSISGRVPSGGGSTSNVGASSGGSRSSGNNHQEDLDHLVVGLQVVQDHLQAFHL